MQNHHISYLRLLELQTDFCRSYINCTEREFQFFPGIPNSISIQLLETTIFLFFNIEFALEQDMYSEYVDTVFEKEKA